MARSDDKLEAQHYVPKMILRNFGRSNRNQLYVFDKKDARSFLSNINNIVKEKGFYDMSNNEKKTISIEQHLSTLEDKTASVFKNIIENRSLATLSSGDRAWIGVFVASQFLRSKNWRQMLKALGDSINQRFASTGGKSEGSDFAFAESEETLRNYAIEYFLENVQPYSELMNHKAWLLMRTTKQNPFWIGDNPVVMHNDRDLGPYGNIGLAVPGIQIYLPLSPTLTLALWCPTLVQQWDEDLGRAKRHRQRLLALRVLGRAPNVPDATTQLAEHGRSIARVEETMACFATGTPAPCSPDHATFLNSLQVQWSARYVMSNHSDFSLAQRMIADNERYREGVRFRTD